MSALASGADGYTDAAANATTNTATHAATGAASAAISAARRRPGPHVLATALVLLVAMGFGRFAFTAIYPLMVHENLLSVRTGSFAASANYAGYLIGAIAVSRAGPCAAGTLCRIGLLGTVLSLFAMALPGGPVVAIVVRFLAGAASAIALVGVSTWLFQVVAYPAGTPLMFAGVGVGILLSSELIVLGKLADWHSPSLWLALGAVAVVLLLLVWRRFGAAAAAASTNPAQSSDAPSRAGMHAWPLILVYSLAGFGYIVTATYLPLFVRQALGSVDPVQVWAAFGLGAAPSCLLWHAVHQRFGTRVALGANLAVQLIGVVLPTISHTPAAFLASALLVGGTFMGTVTIAMPAARLAASQVSFNIVAMMTVGYGIGQIVGPLVSDALFARFGGFEAPLWAAGAVLGMAVAGCAYGRSLSASPASRS